MRPLLFVELIFGWLAVIWGAALLAFTYAGGYIAPESVAQDVIGFSIILAVLALGVTLDYFFSALATRLLLAVGALTVLVVASISFISLSLPSAGLAVVATIIAFTRHNTRSTAQV